MEIIIGTYEEFLVGYTLKKTEGNYSLEQSFTNHAHCGSIRSVAASTKYLASGSVDEGIHLINMKHRIDTGTLISHTGTITAMQFLRSSYLFSASEDGNICIWNTKNWQCEKILRGHKDGVTSLHLHLSGKLLISVSKDKTLRTWNLIKGRCAYIINLKQVAYQVTWSTTCIYFAVIFDTRVDIYDISTGGIIHSIGKEDFDKRITKVIFIDDNTMIISGDCNELMIYDISNKCVVNRFEAHDNRIKDMAWVFLNDIGSDLVDKTDVDENSRWLITVSSDGFIKIWDFDFSNLKSNPTLITKVNSTCRPTCLAFFTSDHDSIKNYDKFEIPELKISKEELLACKSKIEEKKAKRKNLETVQKSETAKQDDLSKNDGKQVAKIKSTKAPNKKLKVEKKEDTSESSKVLKLPNNDIVEDDDEDDVQAIRAMKPTSNALKQLKFKKNKKRNFTTFKTRIQQKRTEKEAKKSASASTSRTTTNGATGGFKVVNMNKKKNNPNRINSPANNNNKRKFNTGANNAKAQRTNKSNGGFKSRPSNKKQFR